MKRLVIGCAVIGLIALSPRSEARLSTFIAHPSLSHILKQEIGLASWYGRELQGNLTASGEAYDLNALTAAHQTLPFGTILRVTNLANWKSVLLRVNDRGPHLARRVLDVSWAAAKRLEFLDSGTARVSVEVVAHAPCLLAER
jgi:rare lipoprotein A